jgi:hypothetical protein
MYGGRRWRGRLEQEVGWPKRFRGIAPCESCDDLGVGMQQEESADRLDVTMSCRGKSWIMRSGKWRSRALPLGQTSGLV